jgi:hypothetical protein
MLGRNAAAAVMFAFTVLVGEPMPTARADDEKVDLVLVLAADISRSVDDKKFRLQREGYASAITDPRVLRAMTGGERGRIALSFLEWASESEQVIIIDWTPIGGESEGKASPGASARRPEHSWGGLPSVPPSTTR